MTLPNVNDIPAELRALAQWVAWRATPPKKPGGKLGKRPIDPTRGTGASITDPSTWGTLDSAMELARAEGLAGIGFVFSTDDEFVGVDLDKCRNPESGELEEWAQEIVTRLASYTEVSPSGTGVHVIVRGKLPEGGRRKGPLEMYDSARFFTVTAERVGDTPANVELRQAELAALHAVTFGPARDLAVSSAPRVTIEASDDALIVAGRSGPHGQLFEALWDGDHSAYESQSEADLALCGLLAHLTGGDKERIDRLFRNSGLMRAKWDQRRGAQTYGERTILKGLEGRSEFFGPNGAPIERAKKSATTVLLELVDESGAEFVHDPAHETYATILVKGHRETMRLRDRSMKAWLRKILHDHGKRVASANVLADVLGVLEGKALHDGQERKVHVRLAERDGVIYLDLGTPDWCVAEISAHGWRTLAAPPELFRRPRGLSALPIPVGGGRIDELRRFVNCTDADWPLVTGWLVAAFRGRGPYPVLALSGEQGSAKSTTARVLRSLIDPNAATLRTEPHDPRDLMIAASNSWVLAFDNLSYLSPWFSDALCRLATGGGFTTRALYSDDEEVFFDAQRPVILTGIEDVVGRSDLLDRAVVCEAPRLREGERQTEEEFLAAFESAKPRILGAVLSAVAAGLRRAPSVRLESPPRMADFAQWATACEPALGLEAGDFMRAYAANRGVSVDLALDASPIASAVRALLDEHPEGLELTATELLARLNRSFTDRRPPKSWPQAPKSLSGALRRIAPDLRAVGVEVDFGRVNGPKRQRVISLRLRDSTPATQGPAEEVDGTSKSLTHGPASAVGPEQASGPATKRSIFDRAPANRRRGPLADDEDARNARGGTINDEGAHRE